MHPSSGQEAVWKHSYNWRVSSLMHPIQILSWDQTCHSHLESMAMQELDLHITYQLTNQGKEMPKQMPFPNIQWMVRVLISQSSSLRLVLFLQRKLKQILHWFDGKLTLISGLPWVMSSTKRQEGSKRKIRTPVPQTNKFLVPVWPNRSEFWDNEFETPPIENTDQSC